MSENEQREKKGVRKKKKRAKWIMDKRKGKEEKREGSEAKMMCSEPKKKKNGYNKKTHGPACPSPLIDNLCWTPKMSTLPVTARAHSTSLIRWTRIYIHCSLQSNNVARLIGYGPSILGCVHTLLVFFSYRSCCIDFFIHPSNPATQWITGRSWTIPFSSSILTRENVRHTPTPDHSFRLTIERLKKKTVPGPC